jgi:predicted phage terminase large subunit-like protein
MNDPTNIVVRGTTYDNKENLPDKFFEDITQYEGTALGRQELHGELINLEEMGIFKRSWFKLWPNSKPFPPCELVVQSWDTAFSDKATADFTVCTTWGLFPSSEGAQGYSAILWDAWADQIAYPDMRNKAIKEYSTKYGPNERRPDIVLIEEKASGQSLIQDLRRAGIPVRAYNPGRQDKVQRAHTVSHLVKDGLIYIPESRQAKNAGQFMTWAVEFIEQLVFFPNSKNDDYVDSFVQFLALMRDTGWMNSARAESDEISYWRRLQKKQAPYG